MPRSAGFARGDLDTAFPLDDKFLDLRGRLTVERYYAATGVYFHVVAATWREAERKVAIRVVPDAADLVAELVAVGLLDPDGRVPSRAFTNHIGRARRQRKAATERQARKRAVGVISESEVGDSDSSTGALKRAGKSRGVTRDNTVTARDSAPLRSVETVGTDGTETGGAGGGNDPWDAPETPVLVWLAEHGCHIRPGNGYHQRLVTAVEVHGAAPMVETMKRLFAAGTKRGDIKGLLFGSIDNLDAQSRPNLRDMERAERDAEREAVRQRRFTPKLEPWQQELRDSLIEHERGLEREFAQQAKSKEPAA